MNNYSSDVGEFMHRLKDHCCEGRPSMAINHSYQLYLHPRVVGFMHLTLPTKLVYFLKEIDSRCGGT
jgi:hypothetical protein